MIDQDAQKVVAESIAEGVRRAPLGYALAALALAIAFLLWTLLSDAKTEREKTAAYIRTLHGELLECHQNRHH